MPHPAQSPAPRDSPQTSAAYAEAPPVVSGYRILRRLGQGGQGTVWLAVHRSTGHRVAIKVIDRQRLGDSHARARFEAGFEILEALRHPNIVRTIERGVLPTGELWHATEYVSGRMLTEFVNALDGQVLDNTRGESRRRQPIESVISLFVKVCNAVEAAHRVGIIHRDLKPSNIIVDETGEPHLLDFGLARAPFNQQMDALTLTGQFIGSPHWASPEQIAGRPTEIDTRSDVYSLGVILYRLLTDQFPYDVSGTLANTFDQIQRAEPIPPRKISTDIDRDLQAVMLKGLAKDKQRRYESVAAFRGDLERYLRGEAVLAKTDTVADWLGRMIRRRPALAASFGVAVVLLVGWAASMTWLYHRTAVAETQATRYAADARIKFRQAHETAAFLVNQVDAALKSAVGMEKTRREIMQKASEQFTRLLADHGDDPALQADLARVHVTLSDLAASVGDQTRQEEHRREALRIRQSLADTNPADDRVQEDLAVSLVLVGDVIKGRSDDVAALHWYERAHRVFVALDGRHPGDPHHLDDLAWSYERVGYLSARLGDKGRALDLYDRRHALCESLAAMAPDDAKRQYNLCASHLVLGDLRGMLRDRSARRAHFAKAASIADVLLRRDPQNREFVQEYLTATKAHARALLEQGAVEQAEPLFESALREAQRVYAIEPERMENQEWLGKAYAGMAQVRQREGRTEDEIAWLTKAEPLLNAVCNALPENDEHLMSCILVRQRLAAVLEPCGGHAESQRENLAIQDLLETRLADRPRDPMVLDRFAGWLFEEAPEEMRNINRARELSERAVEIAQGRDPNLLASLARICYAAGDAQAAVDAQTRFIRAIPSPPLGFDTATAQADIETYRRGLAPASAPLAGSEK